MTELIAFWNRCFTLAKKFDNPEGWKTFMHQAYGGASLFATLEPDAAPMIDDLWEYDWRPAFMDGLFNAKEEG